MDTVGSEIKKTKLLHVLYFLRNDLQTVLIEVQKLHLFRRRTCCDSLESFQNLIRTPLRVVSKIESHQRRHLRQNHRELRHLRAVIEFEVCT